MQFCGQHYALSFFDKYLDHWFKIFPSLGNVLVTSSRTIIDLKIKYPLLIRVASLALRLKEALVLGISRSLSVSRSLCPCQIISIIFGLILFYPNTVIFTIRTKWNSSSSWKSSCKLLGITKLSFRKIIGNGLSIFA